MRGSLRQRSRGSWELRVFVGVDPDTKRRRYRSTTVRGNRADAERELEAMIASVRATRAVGVRSTMSELFDAWYAIASVNWSPNTVRQHDSVLRCHLCPRFGSIRVGDLTPAMIDAVYADLRRNGNTRGGPLAASTVARIHVVLRSSLSQAMRWGWIWDNPAERVHKIVVPEPEISSPTPGEVAQLIDETEQRDPTLCLLMTLAAVTGARRAQLLGLRWSDVRFAKRRIRFCRGWVEGPNGPVLAETKNKRRHSVDLDRATCELLANHAQRAARQAGGVLDPNAFVFAADPAGRSAWKPNRATKAFIRARRAAGIRGVQLRHLRHFMATEMLDGDVPIVVVSHRLGHARTSTTLDRYAQAVPGRDAASAELLVRRIRNATKERRSPGGRATANPASAECVASS